MSNVDIFRRVFTQAGLPQHVVDGIIANFIWESGGRNDINTGNTTGDGGTSWGAAQWRGDRRNALLAFARQRGTDWTDPETQALFTLQELNGSERSAFNRVMATGNVQDATRVFMEAYERPGTPHLEGRLQLAANISGGSPMAYAGSSQPSAGQAAITAAAGPGQDVTAPQGQQRLFMSVADARAARAAGGTPRLDELSNIIQQRRQGMNPLLDRIQQFFAERRANREQSQQAPTPPAPIMAYSGGGGGGGGNGTLSVRQQQEALAAAGFDPGPIDGIRGPRTIAAIRAFQQASGLTVDGIVGPQTTAALAQAASAQPSVPLPLENPSRQPPLPLANPSRISSPVSPSSPPAVLPQAQLDYGVSVPPMGPGPLPMGPMPGSLPGTGSLAGPQPVSAPVTPVERQPLPPIFPEDLSALSNQELATLMNQGATRMIPEWQYQAAQAELDRRRTMAEVGAMGAGVPQPAIDAAAGGGVIPNWGPPPPDPGGWLPGEEAMVARQGLRDGTASMRTGMTTPQRSIGEGQYLPGEQRALMQLAGNMNSAPKANTLLPQLPFMGGFRRTPAPPMGPSPPNARFPLLAMLRGMF